MPSQPPPNEPCARSRGVLSLKTSSSNSRQQGRFLHTGSAQWRAIRQAQLERFPLCQDCEGVAREVDHNTNDTSRNRIGVDLSSLCKPCHSRRTAARERGLESPPVIGCDVHGNPLDPAHPWNREEKSPAA